MRFLGLGSSLLLAGALMLPSTAKADTVFAAGGLLGPAGISSIFVGAGPSSSFTATVQSNVYSNGSAGYAAYKSAIGYAGTTDFIYAYIITDTVQNPSTDSLLHYSVKSGTAIDAVGFDPTGSPTGILPSSSAATVFNGVSATAAYDFLSPTQVLSSSAGHQKSTVLLFASAATPVFQNASLSDGATDSELVVSATGLVLIGQPLPLPTTAFAGAGLLGVLSMGRRRRTKTA